MLRALLLASGLLAFAFVAPASSAAPGVTCQATITVWSEDVHCGTTSTAIDSSESWCPPGARCLFVVIVTCTGNVLFPCTILP